MKQLFLLLTLLIVAGNSWAQKGANSADVIGKLLYTAIKTNNFTLIQNYCLTEEQLYAIQQNGQIEAPGDLENFTADEFNNYLKTNFETAILLRSSDSLTWKGVGLKSVQTDKEQPAGHPKQRVSLLLSDDQERDFQVQFDTMSLNNTYFYLGNIKLVDN